MFLFSCYLNFKVTPPRLERGTPSLKVKCSSQLSYKVIIVVTIGFEPMTASVSGKNSTAELRDNETPYFIQLTGVMVVLRIAIP